MRCGCQAVAAHAVLVLCALVLAGCASQPAPTQDACALFDENGGFFDNWQRHTQHVEQEYGVPAYVVLATIWKESAFEARAKPARRRLLGFIPGPRPSDAYGYPQALDSTWDWYRDETGKRSAKRNRFKDAVDFVGWYHDQSHRRNGVARTDAYNLYLNYYLGQGGYARGDASRNPYARQAAQQVAEQAERYRRQIARCGS